MVVKFGYYSLSNIFWNSKFLHLWVSRLVNLGSFLAWQKNQSIAFRILVPDICISIGLYIPTVHRPHQFPLSKLLRSSSHQVDIQVWYFRKTHLFLAFHQHKRVYNFGEIAWKDPVRFKVAHKEKMCSSAFPFWPILRVANFWKN